MVANPGAFRSSRALVDGCLRKMTDIMHRPPTAKSHANVLQHVAGFVSN